MKTWVKIFDFFIIAVVAGLTFFAAYMAYIKPQEKSEFLIRGQDREWTFPFDANEEIVVSGPIGDTIVRLKDGRAWVESSPCENQTCVASGTIFKQGQWASCLPNHVLVIIHGSEEDDVDIIAR